VTDDEEPEPVEAVPKRLFVSLLTLATVCGAD
jgi:hypothetical protein